MTASAIALGVDIGGSGIKGAPVDLAAGRLVTERVRIDTPEPSTPQAIADVVAEVVARIAAEAPADAPVGVTVPGVVTGGVVRSAANIDPSWIGCDVRDLLSSRLGREVVVVNDADAAGVGELHFGAAAGQRGLVILTTLGTGIGTALIYDGVLVPNSELGHVLIDGQAAEIKAAAAARKRDDLNWDDYAARLTVYYQHLESLLWPDLFVVGGGISRRAERFLPTIRCRTPLVPAALANEAGIIGAAVLARQTYAGGAPPA